MGPMYAMIIFMLAGVAVVAMILFSRNRKQQLLHEERMAALEKGGTIPVIEPRPWSPRVYLLRGLIWSFCGISVIVCLLGLAVASHRPVTASMMAYQAKTLSDTTGISREEANRIVEKDAAEHGDQPPAAIALLGVIPLSVGLAYLVFYHSGDSRKAAGEARTET